MNRILTLIAATGLLLVSGCKPRPPSPEAAAPKPADTAPTAPSVAVLFFEELADRAPGGLSVHADQIERLAAALREKGLSVDVTLVPADEEAPQVPASYDAAVVIDVPEFRSGEVSMLESFVREGGTLVIIGPPAEAAGVLGAAAAFDATDLREGRSLLAHSGPPFPEHYSSGIDWGPLATWRWRLQVRDATVRVADADGAPVLTERVLGEGKAWTLALLPTGRKFNGWAAAPEAVSTLALILREAPVRGRQATASPLRIDVAASRVAYGEEPWPTYVIARLRGGDPSAAVTGTFQAFDAENKLSQKGNLQALPARWRSQFLAADLGKLPPGDYRVEISVPPLAPVSVPIRRSSEALLTSIASALGRWLDGLDLTPPAEVTRVTAREAEDRALLAWALARAREIPGTPDRYRYDLERLGYWFRAAGAQLFRDPAIPQRTLGAMAAGLARSIDPIRRESSMHLSRELQVQAEQAFGLLAARPGEDLSAIGARLWAAAELHRATKITDYRIAADAAARALFAHQLDRGQSVEGDVFGDFFMDPQRTMFAPADGSRAYEVGLLLGLVALENMAEPGPFKIDLGTVLDRYARGFLLSGAAINPYGAFPAGLEPAEPPKPRPDGRGMAPPEKVRTRFYAREAPDAEPGLEAIRIALAVVAMERYFVTGEAAMRRAAADQINHLLGLNPEGHVLWKEGIFLQGLIGRGPERIPVWRSRYSETGAALPGNAWLLALHALLLSGQP